MSRFRLLAVAAPLAALALAGCQVAESRIVQLDGSGLAVGGGACDSSAGSYSLSYTTMQFTVSKGAEGFLLSPINFKHHPDPRFTYCLDHLSSVFASDRLSIGIGVSDADGKKSPNGLLTHVASFAADKTGSVVRKLLRAAFVILSGDPKFGGNRTDTPGAAAVEVGNYEVDPLDPLEMASTNVATKPFGFCLAIDGSSFDPADVDGPTYCRDPQGALRRGPSPVEERSTRQHWLRENADRGGILYRPRLPYQLLVFAKDDPDGREPWRLRETVTIYLENDSPIISIGVNRLLFAENRMGLEFDDGDLTNVCIARSSSLRGFLEIPLDIVYGIVSLPSATITAEINRANSTAALANAEKKLIDTQNAYIAFLESGTLGSLGGPVSGKTISGSTGCPSGGCTSPDILPSPPGAPAFRSEGICKRLTAELGDVP